MNKITGQGLPSLRLVRHYTLWAHSGRELFHVNGRDELVVVELVTQPTFAGGTERVLFSLLDLAIRDRASETSHQPLRR